MKSLTWHYNHHYKLASCGVDAERVDRFLSITRESDFPMPFVFSTKEIKHNQNLANPLRGFCASFCCKEALFKAISASYNFPECEFFLEEAKNSHRLIISEKLKNEICIAESIVEIEFVDYSDYEECFVIVWIFKK